jgi:hypothetical protein
MQCLAKVKISLMVGLVGYAPTTPAMSMQYSTIELQSQEKDNKVIL